MTKLQELKKHLRPGQVYRREDLARWSTAVDRHLKQLVSDGTLTKLAGGLYLYPKETVFGKAPPEDKPRSLEEFLTSSEPELPAQSYPPQVEEVITAALSEAELYESFSSKTRGIAVLENALQTAPEDLRLNRALGLGMVAWPSRDVAVAHGPQLPA